MGRCQALETEGAVSGKKGERGGVMHHLGAIYPTKDGSKVEHWTLCGVAGIVGSDPDCPHCAAAWHAVESLGDISLYDRLEAAHNHIQSLRAQIIASLTATEKAALN